MMPVTTIKNLLVVASQVDQAQVQASAESATHAAAAQDATGTTAQAGQSAPQYGR